MNMVNLISCWGSLSTLDSSVHMYSLSDLWNACQKGICGLELCVHFLSNQWNVNGGEPSLMTVSGLTKSDLVKIQSEALE